MRRKDREQSREFALEAVDTCSYAVLGTVNADGTPYCVPVTIVRDGEAIYFHGALAGQKIENLAARPQVSLACVSRAVTRQQTYSVDYASAIVTGVARLVTEKEEKAHALRILCGRHTPDAMAGVEKHIAADIGHTGVVRITIASITGKANT
ncbi:MAG TPA: pyridoxamine 5'-phosphate oxidase family protein [Feifaniaceae bacterium]|nr:pyridoxamine 5'-phosphate oxidase family protein [Feifaniaceae bacterium]